MDSLVALDNINKSYFKSADWLGLKKIEHKILKDISFAIEADKIFGLIGESGSGKSTLAKTILLMTKFQGDVFFKGTRLNNLNQSGLKKIRSKMQIVFQNPYSSLNPMHRIKDIIFEPLKIHGIDQNQNDTVKELLDYVGIDSGTANNYPHEFSGGQRQRIAIARSLSLRPEFLILDEPVSALDVSVQAQIVNLLLDLKQQFKLTYLFISHNLDLVELICDEVAIMYFGKIVEIGNTKDVYNYPKHPYTQLLLSCVLRPGVSIDNLPVINETKLTVNNQGCPFYEQCRYAKDLCKITNPELLPVNDRQSVACHFPL